MFIKLISFICLWRAVNCYIVDPGPVVKATRGAVWPKPKEQTTKETFFSFDPDSYKFKVTSHSCDRLHGVIKRYESIIKKSNSLERRGRSEEVLQKKQANSLANDANYLAQFNELNINLTSECSDKEMPQLNMSEKYQLTISSNSNELKAASIWGIMRGLETFSQLIHFAQDNYNLIINETQINDEPRFPFRGLLLDTSRHYLPLYIIFETLNAMAYNKMNVLHWHIVDDHSFPYQSKKFPELSNKGAYQPISKIYTQHDVQKVIAFAQDRGIRVLPEFDTPGHTRSWGEGVKNILTECFHKNGKPTGQFGPMDPSRPYLYKFIEQFFGEVIALFPDEYLHLGGDEVEFECWDSNAKLKDFMKQMNISNYEALESYYIQKLLKIVNRNKAKSLVWEEVFVNGVELPNDTIVHVWKGDGYTVLNEVTKAGKPALLSSCWYLDQIANGGDWKKYYNCDPYYMNGTQQQRDLILGGEACMWAESVNEYNISPRIWPRASAAAERLWSTNFGTIAEASQRLEEHACRMNHRGIPAQPPNGPGVCL